MGPAVGANALTMGGGAIVIAAVFESAGALLAGGGDVVSTISKGIISPASMATTDVFIWAMMAALISAALWVNLATWIARRCRPPIRLSAVSWAPESRRPGLPR